MKKYNVLIEETLSRVVTVHASDEEQAQKLVEDMYDNEEIVLDFKDLTHTLIGDEYIEEIT